MFWGGGKGEMEFEGRPGRMMGGKTPEQVVVTQRTEHEGGGNGVGSGAEEREGGNVDL